MKHSAITAAFFITCTPYFTNLSSKASPNATALPAITCSNGPPWVPGNTAPSKIADIGLISPLGVLCPQGFGKSLPIIMMPPRGPLRVLWVVEVTIWQCGIGSFKRPAAIKPAGCETSAINKAPTLSAMALKRA